ncbi:MAG: fatty acid desaturase [Ferruginibacter sp.]
MVEAVTNIDTGNVLDEKRFHSIKAALVNSGGITYIDFKKTLRPHYSKIAFDITKGWLGIAACIIAGVYINTLEAAWLKILLSFADAVLLGFTVNYLGNFFHEASHYNIAPAKEQNDLLANCFLGILQAQHIKHYRQVHWLHHVHLGTPEDTEHSYFTALTPRFFIESLTGIRAARIFLFRSNTAGNGSKEKNTATKKQKLAMLFAGALFHLSALVIAVISGQYWLAGIWLLGFGTFFPFFGSLRQLLEHRGEWARHQNNYFKEPHGKLTRIFSGTAFAAAFGSAGFDRHLLHHLEPQVSYTNLKELETFLSNTEVAAQLQKQKTSYLKTFISLLGK